MPEEHKNSLIVWFYLHTKKKNDNKKEKPYQGPNLDKVFGSNIDDIASKSSSGIISYVTQKVNCFRQIYILRSEKVGMLLFFAMLI